MNILLIEDDVRFGEFISSSIDEVVKVVCTLSDAINYLKVHAVKLVLVDLNLPDSQGLDTLRALSKYHAPKVIISASNAACQDAARLGAIDYILKTSDHEELIRRISFHISRLEPRRHERFSPENFEQIKACLSESSRISLTNRENVLV